MKAKGDEEEVRNVHIPQQTAPVISLNPISHSMIATAAVD